MNKLNIFLLTIFLTVLTSCSGSDEAKKPTQELDTPYPISNKDARDLKRGKITDEGVTLFGGDKGSKHTSGNAETVSAGVNAYLWQASLDVISFMPIATVDAAGGVIITDWYEDPSVKGERLKANIVISSAQLRASGVKVSLFRQVAGKGGWSNGVANPELARKLEDKILTRARELKVQDSRL